MAYEILWTKEALSNLEGILDYLQTKWTQREVNNFKNKLSSLINLIGQRPLLFPKSSYREDLHKAVLSKQTSIFYLVKKNQIHLVFIFDNRMDTKKIEKRQPNN
jgi:plasmid stabilization system protein ParE